MTSNFGFDSTTRKRLGRMVMDKLDDYFSSLPERPVQLPQEERKFVFRPEAAPETGKNPEAVLEEVFERLGDRGFHITSANYLGLMNPTPTFMSVLAEVLVAAFNPQLASVERSGSASLMEKETLHWVGQQIGWKQRFGGVFTIGGSEANATALNLALVRRRPEVVESGVRALPARAVFYASAEAHHSLDKAAGAMGLGRKALRRIPVNADLQMDLGLLEQTIRADIENGFDPFCVVGTAGTTNTGAIDNLAGISAIAKKYGLWSHVDGAYGAAVIFSGQGKKLVRGIESADSVAMDPHKWLAIPFSAGIFLTVHPEMMHATYGTCAPYLRDSDQETLEDQYQTSCQWSRRMNSLKLWMTLQAHGRRSYEELIDRQMEMAASLACWVENSEHFELCAPQSLSAVAFRARMEDASEAEIAAANTAIVEEVNRSGERWISLTTVNGKSAIRMMVISYLTEERHLRDLRDSLESAGARILSKLEAVSGVEA